MQATVARPIQKHNPALRRYCVAAFVSNLGGWMQAGAVPFIVYAQTHRATWVGLATFATYFPAMIASLLGGALADRLPRKQHLIFNQGLQAIVTAMLCVVVTSSHFSMAVFLPLLAVQSLFIGLSIPTWQSFVPSLVPREHVRTAVNLNSAQAQLAKAIGPVLAGIALAQLGAPWAFGVNTLSYVVAAALLATIANRSIQTTQKSETSQKWSDGLKFAFANRTTRVAILLSGYVMFLTYPVYQLVTVVAKQQLHAGATSYGFIVGAFGLGALLGNGALQKLAAIRRSTVVKVALIADGIAIVVTASTHSVAVALLTMTCLGFCYILLTVSALTAVQLSTPDRIRGRVMAVYTFFYVGGTPVGGLLQGWLGDQIGVPATLVLVGGCLVGFSIAMGLGTRITTDLDAAEEPVIDVREKANASTTTGGAERELQLA